MFHCSHTTNTAFNSAKVLNVEPEISFSQSASNTMVSHTYTSASLVYKQTKVSFCDIVIHGTHIHFLPCLVNIMQGTMHIYLQSFAQSNKVTVFWRRFLWQLSSNEWSHSFHCLSMAKKLSSPLAGRRGLHYALAQTTSDSHLKVSALYSVISIETQCAPK